MVAVSDQAHRPNPDPASRGSSHTWQILLARLRAGHAVEDTANISTEAEPSPQASQIAAIKALRSRADSPVVALDYLKAFVDLIEASSSEARPIKTFMKRALSLAKSLIRCSELGVDVSSNVIAFTKAVDELGAGAILTSETDHHLQGLPAVTLSQLGRQHSRNLLSGFFAAVGIITNANSANGLPETPEVSFALPKDLDLPKDAILLEKAVEAEKISISTFVLLTSTAPKDSAVYFLRKLFTQVLADFDDMQERVDAGILNKESRYSAIQDYFKRVPELLTKIEDALKGRGDSLQIETAILGALQRLPDSKIDICLESDGSNIAQALARKAYCHEVANPEPYDIASGKGVTDQRYQRYKQAISQLFESIRSISETV